MFSINLPVHKRERKHSIIAKNKNILKRKKISTRLWLEDNSLLKIAALGFHHGPKIASDPGTCIPHHVYL